MLIEVTGTGAQNKGAELMLVAIKQEVGRWIGAHEIAVNSSFGSFKDRSNHNLLQKMEIQRFGRSRLALSLMPPSFQRSVGIVRDRDVEAVLDASGFAFGDQHPLQRSLDFADKAEHWSRQGKQIILLPQALGPFERHEHRQAFTRIVNAARMVFAREDESFRHAMTAMPNSHKVRQAPDFTNLVKPELTPTAKSLRRVCIVPNTRMIEFAPDQQAKEQYLSLLQNCIDISHAQELEPVLLLHGSEDEVLVQSLQSDSFEKIQIRKIDDVVLLKRYIGESGLVVGSRFHALVSALSQGVPAIATSWSHKYESLFQEYGMPEWVVSASTSRESMESLSSKTMGSDRDAIQEVLAAKGREYEAQTRKMWDEVRQELDVQPGEQERSS